MLVELHTHLYGGLALEDLEWLAAHNEPRWPIFIESYRRAYNSEPNISGLFEGTAESRQRLAATYYFLRPGNFAAFQCAFDLVIALSRTEPEELLEITRRVVGRQESAYAEYRMLLSPRETHESFREKLIALCQGLELASKITGRDARLAMSLPRDPATGRELYRVLRECQAAKRIVQDRLVAIDFCAIEEGYRPRDKASLFDEIISDNRKRPEQALAILYHVGESFEDKSLESAARWVVEAARLGAHRLGHCVALGVPPEFYLGTTRRELACERLDQIDFELREAAQLARAGYDIDRAALEKEAQELSATDPGRSIDVHYDSARIGRARAFQDWAMQAVRETGAIIESCPSSNLRIAGLGSPDWHPLARFLEAELPTVIGADDPGILATGLEAELEMVAGWRGVGREQVARMKARALECTSPALTGRQ